MPGKPRHPNYSKAHPDSQCLHDMLLDWCYSKFNCRYVEKTRGCLTFKTRKSFCAIQYVCITRASITVSVYGALHQHPDHECPLSRGRYDTWSECTVTNEDQLKSLYKIIERAERL